jgi:hypothetical protein
VNLLAIVQEAGHEVRRIRTQQSLQSQLAAEFEKQRDAFFSESEILEFDPRYKVDDDELFVIRNFDLPSFMKNAIRNINQIEDLYLSSGVEIKSIFAAEIDPSVPDSLRLYFQGFMQRRLLVGGWTLLQTRETYKRMQDPGLVLDSSLVAVYEQGNSLYFRSYTLVSRFLDLMEHFVEATDEDIRQVLGDDKFQVDDEAAILNVADSAMRKRFMAVKASGILDLVTVRNTQAQARKFGVEVRTSGGKIVFPTERKKAKALLRLLLEGYYEGPLTGNKYMTNSQKRVE